MPTETTFVTFLDPAAELGVPVVPYSARLGSRRRPLKLALASNGYPDASIFLKDVAEELAALLGPFETTLFEKPKSKAGVAMSREELGNIADNDVIIAGVGHCGSCTSAILRTAREIADFGKPIVVLVTEQFLEETEFVLRAVGMPSLPVVAVPHPIAGLPAAAHQAIARAIAPIVKQSLITGTSSLPPPQVETKAAA